LPDLLSFRATLARTTPRHCAASAQQVASRRAGRTLAWIAGVRPLRTDGMQVRAEGVSGGAEPQPSTPAQHGEDLVSISNDPVSSCGDCARGSTLRHRFARRIQPGGRRPGVWVNLSPVAATLTADCPAGARALSLSAAQGITAPLLLGNLSAPLATPQCRTPKQSFKAWSTRCSKGLSRSKRIPLPLPSPQQWFRRR
jgi:hypothetical protein